MDKEKKRKLKKLCYFCIALLDVFIEIAIDQSFFCDHIIANHLKHCSNHNSLGIC